VFYVYILFSERGDKFYVGHSSDPERRLIEHNTSPELKYTSKFRPWKLLMAIEISDSRGDAIKVEGFLKAQKTSEFLRKIVNEKNNKEFIKGLLDNILVRAIPSPRDTWVAKLNNKIFTIAKNR
jgi:putative endonuclease